MTGSSMETTSRIFPIRAEGAVQADFRKDGRSALSLGEGAVAEYLVLQNEPDNVQQEADFDIRLAAGATLDLVFLSLHGGELRNRIRVSLDGEKAVCNLGGLSVADGEERMDYDIVLTHQVPGCRSNQLFKTILSDRSQARFDGLIKVVPDAQQTEAYQANHNLLCSEEAKAETKPQLEIYADDVKCSHGATVGRLNPDELFYLRSRGIPYEEAQLLQQLAFVDEVLARISDPELREKMADWVEKRLRGEKIA